MKKIIVIGCPGSGKSTFSRELHNKTSIPLYHLDMMYWNADKTKVEKSFFLKQLNNVLNEDMWIIDGNYASTMEMRMAACDTVFFLDYPLEICLEGIAARKGQPRPDMPWVEPDEPDEEFLDFIKNYEKESKPQVLFLLQKYASKSIFRFQSRKHAEDFLNLYQ